MQDSNILDDNFHSHTKEEKSEIKNLKFEIDSALKKEIKNGKITLVVIALFSLAAVLIAMYQDNTSPEVLIEGIILVACYLGLAIYSEVHPKFVFITGFILYCFYQILYLIMDPQSIGRGFILKAVIIYYLFKAIQAGIDIAKKRKRLKVLGVDF